MLEFGTLLLQSTIKRIGSKGVGKTTLVHRFLERDEPAKQTLALEYTFGRKTNQNLIKDVCHIWELGGGTMFTNLLETPLSPSALSSCTLLLVLDLSQPRRIWSTVTTLIASIKEYINAALGTEKAKNLKVEEKLKKQQEIFADHPDLASLELFPVPLVIIGAKYDIFQDFEPEKKKIICRALRYLSHYHGAHLQFYSAKDSGLVKKSRDLLSHFAFKSDESKGVAQDYNKPLIIPAGSDSFQAIFGGGEVPRLQVVKHQYSTMFPEEESETLTQSEDPARDINFKEAEIDMLRSQKDDDLERYRRDVERRAKHFDVDVE